jgi:hypothetical protein
MPLLLGESLSSESRQPSLALSAALLLLMRRIGRGGANASASLLGLRRIVRELCGATRNQTGARLAVVQGSENSHGSESAGKLS